MVRKDGGPRDHNQSRAAICCCCGRKPKNLVPVTEAIASRIRAHVPGLESYAKDSIYFASSICNTCRHAVNETEKDPGQTKRKFPPLLDYSSIFSRSTRSDGKAIIETEGIVCPCSLCDIARRTLDYPDFHAAHSNSKARKRSRSLTPELARKHIKICPKCHGEIAPGKHKDCGRAANQENLEEILVRQSSERTKQKVTSSLVKAIAADGDVSTSGGTIHLATGGPSLPIKIGKGRNDDRDNTIITHDDMFGLQERIGGSDNTINTINSSFAAVVGNNRMEPGFKEALAKRNVALQDFFVLREDLLWNKTIEEKKKVRVSRPMVSSDVASLITFIIWFRDLDPDTAKVQLGLDNGGGVLKLVGLVYPDVDGTQPPARKRARHRDGIRGRDFKLTSGKKGFFLAGVPDVNEDDENVAQLLAVCDISDLGNDPLSLDIKMQLYTLGKQSASCTRNCPYCECFAPYICICPPNTFASLDAHHASYEAPVNEGGGGGIKKNAKNHNNCVRPRLLQGPPDTRVIDRLYFPELHTLTGITGKIVSALIESFPKTEAEVGKLWLEGFMKRHNIQWRVDRPNTFLGYHARKFVRLGDTLRQEAKKSNLPIAAALKTMYYARVLSKYNDVIVSCYGQILEDNFKETIKEFEIAYRNLDTSVTLKCHLVFVHIVEFLERKGLVAGLGAFSEQQMEEMHHEWCDEWENKFTNVNPDHPLYTQFFFKCFVKINSKHL